MNSFFLLAAMVSVSCSSDVKAPGSDAATAPDDNSGSSPGDPGSSVAGGDGSPQDDLTANEQLLVNMPADSWLKVPNGFIAKCDETIGNCLGIFAWSSGVYDTTANQFLLWGGGHMDYPGNEVYAFRLSTFEWERLTVPSPPPYSQDPLNDGKPVSRHTYDGLAWLTDSQRMFAFGGSRSQDGQGTSVTWTFDPATTTWENRAPAMFPRGGYNYSGVYVPGTAGTMGETGSVLLWAYSLWRYDVAANTWTMINDGGMPPFWPRYGAGNPRGTVDTKRRNVWFVGGGLYLVYQNDQDKFVTNDWVTTGGGQFNNGDQFAVIKGYPDQLITTGGGDVITAPAPGLDYDVKADSLVAWIGGGPYELDLSTKTWTQKSGEGAPDGYDASIFHGTFGRWRYVPKYNVFILINGTDEVYFYKNRAGN